MWNYYRDEGNDDESENDNVNNIINNNKTIKSKSFEYKTKIIGRIPADNNTLDVKKCCATKIFDEFLEISWFATH